MQGVIQLDLARGTDVSLTSIFGYETGERAVDPATTRKLASALDGPVERLMPNPMQAARAVTARSASTSTKRFRGEHLRTRLEYAFLQLFDRSALPNEQLEEIFEEAHVVPGALDGTMSIETDSFLETISPTLTAEELRHLCVAFYYEELIRKGEDASKQRPILIE